MRVKKQILTRDLFRDEVDEEWETHDKHGPYVFMCYSAVNRYFPECKESLQIRLEVTNVAMAGWYECDFNPGQDWLGVHVEKDNGQITEEDLDSSLTNFLGRLAAGTIWVNIYPVD